jgi:hypothetical protein
MSGAIAAMAGMKKPGAVTVSANWGTFDGDTVSGAASAVRTLTVPAGNPGSLNFALTSLGVDIHYKKNGGAATLVTDGLDVTFANGDTLQFVVIAGGGTGSAEVTVTDNLRGDAVGDGETTIS